MNAETLIRAAQHDGLRLALTGSGTVKCIGRKLVTERWAPQLRQQKVEILALLTAANDAANDADEASSAWWDTFLSRVTECDELIHQLCSLRGDDEARRADLLATRKRTSPANLDGDIEYLMSEIASLTAPAAPTTGRCIACQHFKLAGLGHRCSHPERVLPNEPPIVECLPDNQCNQFVHWCPLQSKDSTL